MKLKSQLIISIVIFGIILLVISASVIITNQQAVKIINEQQTAGQIQTGASNLAYISNDYFLYQDSAQLSQWQTQFSSMSTDLSKINSTTLEQATLINNVETDLQLVGAGFNSSVLFIESSPRNESIRVLPEFQDDWSGLAVQNQELAYAAYVLSNSFENQANQQKQTESILIFSLLAAFAAYFIMIYLLVFRRTFRSITKLQEGTKIIGSGNLDYTIASTTNDEVGELSEAFNQMTTNLKTVTASKTDLEQAQASLQKSEQRWATTLASIGDAVIATDISGKIMFMNSEAEDLTGWTLSEASQKPVKEAFNIVNEQTRLDVENPIDRVLKEGMVVGLANHTVLIRKDGSEVPIDDSGAPIRDKDGRTTGVVLIFRDITERKKAEDALMKQAELIDLSPDAIVVQQMDGTITFWSRGAEKLYGWTKEEAIGKNIHTLLKTEFRLPLEEILNTVKLDGKWSGELVHINKDGSKVAEQSYWLGKFDSDGKIVEMLESNVDITERVELQVKLEESAVRLEEYANQMEELAEKRAAQLKDAERLAAIGATAGMVGHDIRNPLQAITGDVFLAKTELDSMPESVEKKNALESLAEIEKNIDYINKIVQDLQDYARPLNPKVEESDLRQIVEGLFAKNRVPENVEVTVEVAEGTRKIRVDSYYLNRILVNLVTNAVQAMPQGGKLAVRAYKEESDTVITVSDTGVGIPKAIQEKMFTLMFTTKSKGQGFGLPVVKRMIESLGGTVTFKSKEGKGTTFMVRLPPRDGRTRLTHEMV